MDQDDDQISIAQSGTIRSFELSSVRDSRISEYPISLHEDDGDSIAERLANRRITANEFFLLGARTSDNRSVTSDISTLHGGHVHSGVGSRSPVSALDENEHVQGPGRASKSHPATSMNPSLLPAPRKWNEGNELPPYLSSYTKSGISDGSYPDPLSEVWSSVVGEDPVSPRFQSGHQPPVGKSTVYSGTSSAPRIIPTQNAQNLTFPGLGSSRQIVPTVSPVGQGLTARNKLNEARGIPNTPSVVAEQRAERMKNQTDAQDRYFGRLEPPSQTRNPFTATEIRTEARYDWASQTTSRLDPTRTPTPTLPLPPSGPLLPGNTSERRTVAQNEQARKRTEAEELKMKQDINRKVLAVYKAYQIEVREIKDDPNLDYGQKRQREREAEARMRQKACQMLQDDGSYDLGDVAVAVEHAVAEARGDHPPSSQKDSEFVKAVKWMGVKAWRAFRWFNAVPDDPSLKSYSRRYGLAELPDPPPPPPPPPAVPKRAKSMENLLSKKSKKPKRTQSLASIDKLTGQVKAKMDESDKRRLKVQVPGMGSESSMGHWPTQSEAEGTQVYGSDGRRF